MRRLLISQPSSAALTLETQRSVQRGRGSRRFQHCSRLPQVCAAPPCAGDEGPGVRAGAAESRRKGPNPQALSGCFSCPLQGLWPLFSGPCSLVFLRLTQALGPRPDLCGLGRRTLAGRHPGRCAGGAECHVVGLWVERPGVVGSLQVLTACRAPACGRSCWLHAWGYPGPAWGSKLGTRLRGAYPGVVLDPGVPQDACDAPPPRDVVILPRLCFGASWRRAKQHGPGAAPARRLAQDPDQPHDEATSAVYHRHAPGSQGAGLGMSRGAGSPALRGRTTPSWRGHLLFPRVPKFQALSALCPPGGCAAWLTLSPRCLDYGSGGARSTTPRAM